MKKHNNYPGIFLSFEGNECTGKSTLAPLLAEHLRDRGYTVTRTREPGGSPLAEEIRELLLKESNMGGLTEALLFWAGRADHVQNTILPALQAGHVVICERFADSSYAFQGMGRDIQHETLVLEDMVLKGLEPDHTLYFEIPFEEQRRRMDLRNAAVDRIEKQGPEFYTKVYEGYRQRFLANQHRMTRIDSLPSEDVVQASVLRWANSVFENLT